MRIGIFGGTFDPPHLGHLILAERCREAASLDEVWFLPSFQPPHKLERMLTRFDTRCELVSLAIVGQPSFKVSRFESEIPPPSFTTETLRHLHERHPQDEFHLIIGSDSLADFPAWYHPERIVTQAHLIVVARPGTELISTNQLAEKIGVAASAIHIQLVESPLIAISSTEIRERVLAGKTIRYLVPRAVEEFIRERRLYS